MARAEVEALLDALLGWPWAVWDARLSGLLDAAVMREEAAQ
jgi:hypothetical protein